MECIAGWMGMLHPPGHLTRRGRKYQGCHSRCNLDRDQLHNRLAHHWRCSHCLQAGNHQRRRLGCSPSQRRHRSRHRSRQGCCRRRRPCHKHRSNRRHRNLAHSHQRCRSGRNRPEGRSMNRHRTHRLHRRCHRRRHTHRWLRRCRNLPDRSLRRRCYRSR